MRCSIEMYTKEADRALSFAHSQSSSPGWYEVPSWSSILSMSALWSKYTLHPRFSNPSRYLSFAKYIISATYGLPSLQLSSWVTFLTRKFPRLLKNTRLILASESGAIHRPSYFWHWSLIISRIKIRWDYNWMKYRSKWKKRAKLTGSMIAPCKFFVRISLHIVARSNTGSLFGSENGRSQPKMGASWPISQIRGKNSSTFHRFH